MKDDGIIYCNEEILNIPPSIVSEKNMYHELFYTASDVRQVLQKLKDNNSLL